MLKYLLTILLLTVCAMGARAEKMPWLRAEGTRIVNERGETVVLRGINLGGWLVEEMWMMPFITEPPAGTDYPKIGDHVSLWRTVEKRMGTRDMERLRTAFRSAWITEADFDRIKAVGFNCVRLPFLHSLADEPGGLTWLDKAVNWAGKRGIYVIFDMHGMPGGQSIEHHTGEMNRNQFFKDPAMVKRGEEVWTQIARRYKNRPEVAGYDLMNEPMGAPDRTVLYQTTDRLYKAVRAADSRHLIFIEDGYKGIDKMPKPSEYGWQNVAMSFHSYKFDAKSPQDHLDMLNWYRPLVEKALAEYNTPGYLGEFNLEPWGNGDTMAAWVSTVQKGGVSWSLWTYKIAMKGGNGSMWGLYRAVKAVDPLDPYRDSVEDWTRKCAQVRTENLEEHAGLAKAFRDVANLAAGGSASK